MKIVQFTAENVKKLRAVEIKPDGSLVVIAGKNGAGKSSVLDAIFYALAGGKDLPSQPIRKGEQSAKVRLDLGEIIVTRKFTASGSTLTVEGTNGARFPSPQRMLDDLIGAISFDPLAFTRMDARGQFDMLRKVVPLDVDIDALNGLNKRDYEARTDINRRAKALRAQADGIRVPEGLPAEPVDTKALMDRMASAAEHNADIETRKANRTAAVEKVAKLTADADALEPEMTARVQEIERTANDRIARIRAEMERLDKEMTEVAAKAAIDIAAARDASEKRAAALRAEAASLQKKLDEAKPLADPIDVSALRAEVDAATATNAGIDARGRRQAVVTEAEKLEAESQGLTDAMAAREKAKADAIQAAQMPVADLTFGDGAILYRGLPFDQASSAEQLRVSVGIAMAANPKLRVLRVKEGSLLDEDGLRMVEEMANSADYQVWCERVGTDGKVSVVMEDGAIRAPGDEPKLDLGAAA